MLVRMSVVWGVDNRISQRDLVTAVMGYEFGGAIEEGENLYVNTKIETLAHLGTRGS